jgi:hypothetical protein
MAGINDEVIAHAQGLQGELFLFRERMRISRKVTGTYFSYGARGYKDIPIKDISSIKYQATGMFNNGFIQISLKGQADHDENMLVFTKQEESEFKQFRDKLQSILPTPTAQPDKGSDDLEKPADFKVK